MLKGADPEVLGPGQDGSDGSQMAFAGNRDASSNSRRGSPSGDVFEGKRTDGRWPLLPERDLVERHAKINEVLGPGRDGPDGSQMTFAGNRDASSNSGVFTVYEPPFLVGTIFGRRP